MNTNYLVAEVTPLPTVVHPLPEISKIFANITIYRPYIWTLPTYLTLCMSKMTGIFAKNVIYQEKISNPLHNVYSLRRDRYIFQGLFVLSASQFSSPQF